MMTGEPEGPRPASLGDMLAAVEQTDIIAFRSSGEVLEARCQMMLPLRPGDNVFDTVPVLQGLESHIEELRPQNSSFVMPRVTLAGQGDQEHTLDISIAATSQGDTLLLVARRTIDDPVQIKSVKGRRRMEYLESMMEEERARFESIYRRSPVLAFVLSDDDTLLTWSDAFEQWAGGTPRLAREWIEAFRHDRLAQSPDLNNDRVLHGVRAGLTDGAGRICAVDLYRYRVRRARTRSSDDYFVIQDVTSLLSTLRLLERQSGELAQLNAKLEISNARLSDFSRVAAHDLVGPLGRIASFSELMAINLAEDDLPVPGALDAIRQSAQSCIALVNDLLDLASLGSAELRPEHCDVEQIAEETFSLYASGIDDGHGAPYLTFEGPRDLFTDPRLLRLILRNTIGNSIKFRARTRALRIAIKVQRGDGRYKLTIRDDGLGYDPSDDRNVFDIMVRATPDASLAGSGLGLSLVRDAARLMGFDVSLEGQIDKGARFTMQGVDPSA